jgi:putative endonuclease
MSDKYDIPEVQRAIPMARNPKALGRHGEDLAARYLERRGFRLVAANFRVPIGRSRVGVQVTGEIDLIALDGDTLCFIEIKSRSSEEIKSALAAVDLRKQRQIIRAARVYKRIFRIDDVEFRYDVVTIVKDAGALPKIELIRGLWTEAKFRKRAWSDEF